MTKGGNLFDAMFEELQINPDPFYPMFEADGDPPHAPPESPAPEQDAAVEMPPAMDDGSDMSAGDSSDGGVESPPDIGYDDGGGIGEEGEGQDGQQEEDNTTLDEKGEIFAKLDILKSYNSLYKKLEDTVDTIDKIDLVQTGNNINPKDVADIQDLIAELMDDVSSTIIYEFQQSYANLKIKLVSYSAKYVTYMKQFVKLIKKDQGVKPE